MLELKNIVKNYDSGDEKVEALRGINLSFRRSEFVSVLGPSGCGKTTLLNILGGLDRYTSGDLIINGRSTKEYRDADWDAYRNHSVGFVFQSYNLIPHQTVLANVELALTLSGVNKTERRKRAADALKRVGLGDQLKKRPGQMSGGQMQRVAIARALVNNPDILLADEPTGALDSATSVQVMDILREVSADRLVVMVTHNRELAEQYSTRIVTLLDGEVTGDTQPFDSTAEKEEPSLPQKKLKAMSLGTAISLSFNNLMTKRARTLLTSFAGSIGIIGIALILALSTGVQAYIDGVQRDTLSSYPITIETEESGLSTILSALGTTMNSSDEGEEHDDSAVYSNPQMYTMFNAVFAQETRQNDLAAFKNWLDGNDTLSGYIDSVQYGYDIDINAYVKNSEGNYVTCDIADAFSSGADSNAEMYRMLSNQMRMINLWEEILPSSDGTLVSEAYKSRHELVYGSWPQAADEIVLILDKNNELSDLAFYALGIIPSDEVSDIINAAVNGDEIEPTDRTLSYEDACSIEFKLITAGDLYADNDGDGIYEYIGDDENLLNMIVRSGRDVKITGIVRSTADSSATTYAASFGYTSALTGQLIAEAAETPAAKAQALDSGTDVLTGLPFELADAEGLTALEKADLVYEYFASLTDQEKTEQYITVLSEPSAEYVSDTVEKYMAMYDTRDKMEQLAADSYGIDLETIRSYLSGYSDAELEDMLREQLESVVREQYASAAKQSVDDIMNTPSDMELQALISSITSQLTSREIKTAYVAQAWSESISMSEDALYSYLASLDDAALDDVVYDCAKASAAEMYTSGGYASSGDYAYAKAAAAFDEMVAGATTDELASWYELCMPSSLSSSTYDGNMTTLGAVNPDIPSTISIYARSFEDKDAISALISEYNSGVSDEAQITYTDYVALLMSGVTNIINAVSYGLIFFVSISLVVSSIMIGIITYISVLERTKEIGVLRSVGASKRDVSRVFNAETAIVGLGAGLIGVGISLICCIPITLIIHALSGVDAINAYLEPLHCVILVAISMILTLIAGLIPSRIAAKKNPVEALRSE